MVPLSWWPDRTVYHSSSVPSSLTEPALPRVERPTQSPTSRINSAKSQQRHGKSRPLRIANQTVPLVTHHRRTRTKEIPMSMQHRWPSALLASSLLWGVTAPLATWAWRAPPTPDVEAFDPERVGRTETDRRRNATLLAGYEYDKYVAAITGYNGQDRQQVVFWNRQRAVRTRVGPRGNYKCGMTLGPDGTLLLATCKNNNLDDPMKKRFDIWVYASTDNGESWELIGETPLSGKEPSLTTLSDGSVVLSAQKGYFGPGTKYKEEINLARSTDGGRTWRKSTLAGSDYPRNMIIEKNGSLLFVRAAEFDWTRANEGSPHFQLCRSGDGGRTWSFSEGVIKWDAKRPFGEVSAILLRDGRLLAAIRSLQRGAPRKDMHGYGITLLTESNDNGQTWSNPRAMSHTAEVHTYLTELVDGRILATYSNYHLPFGVYAIVSNDGGRTWDRDHPIQLALSALNQVGWPVTLQLADGSLLTGYALTAYLKQPPDMFVTETVRWRLP
ncbi:MAG: hypothetical protein CMJ59_21585 [Planctomycetaceae bacterium]|nr:hypothetical protein [Planctomycetaceae bacterium]